MASRLSKANLASIDHSELPLFRGWARGLIEVEDGIEGMADVVATRNVII